MLQLKWTIRRLRWKQQAVCAQSENQRLSWLQPAMYLLVGAAVLVSPLNAQVSPYLDDYENALKESAETGKPVFALGLRESCGNCQALVQRIREDGQIQKLLTGFVLLQMDVDKESHLAWRKPVPFEGNTLPIVYAVRADRQPMFAKSTTLPDHEFPALLMESLSTGGAVLQARDIELLDTASQSVKKMLESGDMPELVRETRKARKFLLDHSPCFARAALDFQNAFLPLIEEGKKAIADLSELSEGASSSETVALRSLAFAQAEFKLEQLDLLAKEFKAAEKKMNGVREVRLALADARKLVTATANKQLSESQRKALLEIAQRQAGNAIGIRATELSASQK